MPSFFDAHLDLAYMALAGRDMLAADPATAGGEDPPGGVTLPTLRGHVHACLATIFTEPGGKPSAYSYPAGDAAAARHAGLAQLRVYEGWAADGSIHIELSDTAGALARAARHHAPDMHDAAPTVGILIEGADPIAGPDDLPFWASRGVVAVGLAWARASRYAAGNATPAAEDAGLTPAGRDLARAIDAFGLIHDISHLSDRALDDLLALTNRPVMASHSNCRAIIDGNGTEVRQRHLSDNTLREIARRGGWVGLNLFSPFILPGARRDRRATLAEWAAHAAHAATVMGTRAMIGLGSDMDGGFSRLMMPDGIDGPADLPRLSDALRKAGWTSAETAAFRSRTFADFLGRVHQNRR